MSPNVDKVQSLLIQKNFSKITKVAPSSTSEIAALLKSGKIVGIMRGRAEFGPRALGHRSILASPAIEGMKDKIILRVKGREAYRPFAPVIKKENVSNWFSYEISSPYMSFAIPWKEDKAKLVPAVVHFDRTGRLQTVERNTQPWLSDLLDELELLGLPPILLNTSFNIMGKPIVHDVEDAISVLLTSGLDAVLLENILIEK
jgi:carbamoyltransferase